MSGYISGYRDAQAKWRGDNDRLESENARLRKTLVAVADYLDTAATFQDRPGAMAEHQQMAAAVRASLIPDPS